VALDQTEIITVEAPAAAAPLTDTAALTATGATTAAAGVTGTAGITGTAGVTGTNAATQTAAVTGTTAVTAPAGAAPVAAAPALTASLKVETDIINVRSGPGTGFGLVGTANLGERFEIVGRNAEGTWYQICCVNGQQGWVSGELTDEENEELAQVVAAPTAAPVAQAPAEPAPTQPPAAAPAEPTATPAPAAPAPAPAGDACAGIGGDGCKFKIRGGPSFAANGGTELKLQLGFIHSGIDGGQPQSSYFVWVEKDGQKLPVPDSVRSYSPAQQGPQGTYNYEYKLAPNQLPGGTVAGNYVIWVLDGNGERDSQTFSFTVPEGQGEVWIQFDQA
jgi:cell division septation protein DedD